MEAVEAKKASFAGISGSCTADLTVTSMTTELEWKNISFCGFTEVFSFCR